MSFNLESSHDNEINEVPEVEIDSEQLSQTEETAENFDDCSLNEVRDSKGNEVSADSLEEAEENYDDCEAKVAEKEEEYPELAEDDYDDFNDCGKETEGQYAAEVTYTTDGEVSPEEAEAELQEAYNECDNPEDMQQLKENANENEHIQVYHAEVVERPEDNEVKDEITEAEYEAAQEELDEAQENLEAQQEAAQEYQDNLKNQINNYKDEIPQGNENIEDERSEENESVSDERFEVTEETMDSEGEEKGDETTESEEINETLEDEEVEDTAEETEQEHLESSNDDAQENEPFEEQDENTDQPSETAENDAEDVTEESSLEGETPDSGNMEQVNEESEVESSNINGENVNEGVSPKNEGEEDSEFSDESQKPEQEEVSDDAADSESVDNVTETLPDETVENEGLTEDAREEQVAEGGSEQANVNLPKENAESIADETDNSAEDAVEDKKEEKESLEETAKTTGEIEDEQAETAAQQEKLSLQERIDKAFENGEVSSNEINKLKEEHAAELEAKVEERDAIEAQRKSKFDEVLSKEKGSEEYKQALQEYNALQDQKMVLDEQVAEMKNQQSLLDEKASSANKAQQTETEEKSLFGWFNRKQPDTTEMPAVHFGTYEVGSYGFIKGENYQSYIKDWEGYSADRYKTEMFDQAREQTISPSLVEGIRVSDSDIENPDIFWSQHEPGGTVESFEKIAANIPEVRDRLTAGESLSDLIEDPQLGRCASIYFHPDSMPEVIKCGDYYEFQTNGRHRILAARNMGYDIPVRVIGERTIEDSGLGEPNGLETTNIEQTTTQNQQDIWDENKWGPDPFKGTAKSEWDEDKWGPDPFKSRDSSYQNISDAKDNVSIVGSLEEAKDFDSLSSYMETKYGIQLDHSIKQLEFTTVKNAISGLESVVKEYPDVGDLLKKSITSNSGVMSCSGDTLSFNPAYFSDKYTLTKVCNEQSAKKYWVPNASPETIGVHEAAHGIEWALIQANPQYTNDNERVTAWNNCDEAKKIVCEACNNLRHTPFGQTKNAIDHIRSISGYAMKDRSETMAEAFADVAANGEKAQPLSKEITRLTKVYMNKYKGGK